MGGKGENNMAPRGRHLIETKDQKMFIMSIVQKKRIRKHHIHRTTGKQDERGRKIMAPSGREQRPFPRKLEKISSPSDHLKSNTAYRNSLGRKKTKLETFTCV